MDKVSSTLTLTHVPVHTYYRREQDQSLSLKLEGSMEGVHTCMIPLFEQVCVLNEVNLHYKWAPFCSSSMKIADLDKVDTVGWFMISLPTFGLVVPLGVITFSKMEPS
jgi:hypothetical protein